MRKCNLCDFETESKLVGLSGNSEELAAMSDHLTQHNPTPAQWKVAYDRIRATRKKSEPAA